MQLIFLSRVVQEIQVQSLGQEDPLEEEMATHASRLAWKISYIEGACWAALHGVTRVGHDLVIKQPPVWFY